jgi:hypothetical protein
MDRNTRTRSVVVLAAPKAHCKYTFDTGLKRLFHPPAHISYVDSNASLVCNQRTINFLRPIPLRPNRDLLIPSEGLSPVSRTNESVQVLKMYRLSYLLDYNFVVI